MTEEPLWVVRQATPSDSKALAEFFWQTLPVFFPTFAEFDQHLEFFLGEENRFSIVAELPNHGCNDGLRSRIIGFVSIELICRPRGGIFAYLGEVLVGAEFRRKGVASKLIGFACQLAERKMCHRVILHCSVEWSEFYKKVGFKSWEVGMRRDFLV